jgi:aminoglycoside phosphotransferase (APT) family kinase protein
MRRILLLRLRAAVGYKTWMSLVEAAVGRLASHWGRVVDVGEVLVDHQDRAVIRSLDPAGRPIVIKVDRDAARSRLEARALVAAAAAGVPVPTVHGRLDGPPSILVLEHVDGRPLGSTGPDEHWRTVGRHLRGLHDRAEPDGLPPFGGDPMLGAHAGWWSRLRRLADWATGWCRERRALEPDVLTRLHALMSSAFARDDEPADRLLHGDCGPYHWLLREDAATEVDVAAVVDFGDSGRGDPAWDLAVLVLWDSDRLPAVLDAYGPDEAMRSHLEALLRPYTVLRHLLAIPWLVDHDEDPTPTVTELLRIDRRPDRPPPRSSGVR